VSVAVESRNIWARVYKTGGEATFSTVVYFHYADGVSAVSIANNPFAVKFVFIQIERLFLLVLLILN